MKHSLQRRVTIAMMVLITCVGIAGGLGAFFVAREEPDQFLDDQLHRLALNVSDAVPPDVPDALEVPLLDPDDRLVIQIWEKGGGLIRSTEPDVHIPRQKTTGFSDLVTEGESWRTFTLVYNKRTVQISQSAEVRLELATDSAIRAVLPMLVLLPLSWLILGGAVSRLMAPLRGLARALERRPAGSFEPLPTSGLPTEVAPAVSALNDLLARQHAFIERRRQFLADAAHQLRTPLAALRLQMDNLSRHGDAPPAGLVREANEGVTRLIAMSTKMLQLARTEQGGDSGGAASVDLGELTRAAIAEALPLARSRNIDLGAARLDPAHIVARPEDVHAVVGNLIDNALKYAPAGTAVDVSIEVDPAGATIIEVADRGPGIPAHLMSQVFERFFRIEGNEADGTGLGLAIARAAACNFGADIVLANREPGPGLAASVRLAGSHTTTPIA